MKRKILNWKNVFTSMLVSMLLVSAFTFVSCGDNKKGLMTLNAVGDDIALYETAFKKHFDVQAIDAAQYGYDFVVSPSRYVVCIINSDNNLNSPEPYDKGFLILISDEGESADVEYIYTVGDKEENPVIINPNLLAGKMTITKSLTITPKNAKGSEERIAEIVNTVYEKLVEIEGK